MIPKNQINRRYDSYKGSVIQNAFNLLNLNKYSSPVIHRKIRLSFITN